MSTVTLKCRNPKCSEDFLFQIRGNINMKRCSRGQVHVKIHFYYQMNDHHDLSASSALSLSVSFSLPPPLSFILSFSLPHTPSFSLPLPLFLFPFSFLLSLSSYLLPLLSPSPSSLFLSLSVNQSLRLTQENFQEAWSAVAVFVWSKCQQQIYCRKAAAGVPRSIVSIFNTHLETSNATQWIPRCWLMLAALLGDMYTTGMMFFNMMIFIFH